MPRVPIHPGEHLAEELGALEMSAAALARQLKVTSNRRPHLREPRLLVVPKGDHRVDVRRRTCRVVAGQ